MFTSWAVVMNGWQWLCMYMCLCVCVCGVGGGGGRGGVNLKIIMIDVQCLRNMLACK